MSMDLSRGHLRRTPSAMVAIGSAGFVIIIMFALTSGCRQQATAPQVENGPSILELVGPDEPGTRLVLTGRVFDEDGATPLEGAKLDVYQTDADGYYTRPVSVARNARLRGSVWVDAEGRYEIRTIMPGHYPNATEAAHIHVHLEAPGVPDHWIDSFLFAQDPHLTESDVSQNERLGAFSAIVELNENAEGSLRGTRDIRLDRAQAERNRLVNGWYRGE